MLLFSGIREVTPVVRAVEWLRSRAARGVDVVEGDTSEGVLLIDVLPIEAALPEQGSDRGEAAFAVVNLDHGLPDERPVGGVDAPEDLELLSLDVHLEEIDARESLLADDLGEGAELAAEALCPTPKAPGNEAADRRREEPRPPHPLRRVPHRAHDPAL